MALFGFDLSVVPDIDFCVKDASVVESEVLTNYEKFFYQQFSIQKTLGRGDPVRLLLLSHIYQLIVQRSIVDSTGKENLIKYSHGDDLDNIGAFYGPTRGSRLKATQSTTNLRFSLSSGLVLGSDSIIPAGTLAQTNSGIVFYTIDTTTILSGSLDADVTAKAVNAGELANGMVPGQINQLVSWSAPFLVSVTNTTTSGGGADVETDDHYRARIWMAPESFSVAGPKEAYEYWAATANPDIIDVSVWSDAAHAGQVYIFPLMLGGALPDQNVIDQVYASCNADDIRPLTDQVFVQAPTPHTVIANVQFWIDSAKGAFEGNIEQACQIAFNNWMVWQSSEIGLDIVPSKLIQMLIDAGAKRVDVISPVFTIIDDMTLAVIDPSSTLSYQGMEER